MKKLVEKTVLIWNSFAVVAPSTAPFHRATFLSTMPTISLEMRNERLQQLYDTDISVIYLCLLFAVKMQNRNRFKNSVIVRFYITCIRTYILLVYFHTQTGDISLSRHLISTNLLFPMLNCLVNDEICDDKTLYVINNNTFFFPDFKFRSESYFNFLYNISYVLRNSFEWRDCVTAWWAKTVIEFLQIIIIFYSDEASGFKRKWNIFCTRIYIDV